MYGQIEQNNLCIDIEIGHVPAIAKLVTCDADRDTQVNSDTIFTHYYLINLS